MRREEWRKLFEADYETDETTGRRRAVSRYIGPWYALDSTKRRRCVCQMWIGLVLGVAVFLAAGLIPTWASLCTYVVVWYIACLLPLFYLLLGTVKITRMKEKITEIDKAEGLAYARYASMGLAVLGGAWLISDGIFLMSGSHVMTMTYELIFLGCGALMTALGVWMYLAARRLQPVPMTDNEKEAADAAASDSAGETDDITC